ncbi:hypothetical protein CDV36_003905 [Fusarium kuroshium]|uniref:Uncharacterized protein n=1 Tax=Fusarium kuroshium TaxID=2010991 RepID=A0A3M2SFV1_9HYPO|nr:hypothetical protein CDV36_003905 [Fusarium kuroshium]
MDCALTHCWDQVYSCEYQETVEQVIKTCDDAPEEGFPFYPAPVDAPNACSCNKAKVVETVGKVLEEQNDCEGGASDAWESLPRAEFKAKVAPACVCCSWSAALSAYWNICPDMDPNYLGVDSFFHSLMGGAWEKWPKCKFDNSTCHTEYNYTLPGNKDAKFYEPGKFPKNGTQTTMTNLAGTITSPISGATFTWTMNSTAHTIIAAGVQTTAASASTTGTKGNTTPTGAGLYACGTALLGWLGMSKFSDFLTNQTAGRENSCNPTKQGGSVKTTKLGPSSRQSHLQAPVPVS